jgi:uridine kinase
VDKEAVVHGTSVRRVIAIAGASGSGKTSTAGASGLPILSLDSFYRSRDASGLPRWLGDVDWENPDSFNLDAAIAATRSLILHGIAVFRAHDLVTEVVSECVEEVRASGRCLVVEGVMATEVVASLRDELRNVELVFYYLHRNRFASFVGRIERDVLARHRRWHRAVLRSLRVTWVERRARRSAITRGAHVVNRTGLQKKLADEGRNPVALS